MPGSDAVTETPDGPYSPVPIGTVRCAGRFRAGASAAPAAPDPPAAAARPTGGP